jgi:Putative mono-oxygenase ydhR
MMEGAMKTISKVFLYAEYQAAMPFAEIDWAPINTAMKQCPGLKSKTWLSGVNTHSVGGFYEFDSLANAQKYIEDLLLPFGRRIGASLSVRLFDGDVTRDASTGMASPFYPA